MIPSCPPPNPSAPRRPPALQCFLHQPPACSHESLFAARATVPPARALELHPFPFHRRGLRSQSEVALRRGCFFSLQHSGIALLSAQYSRATHLHRHALPSTTPVSAPRPCIHPPTTIGPFSTLTANTLSTLRSLLPPLLPSFVHTSNNVQKASRSRKRVLDH